MSIVYVTIAWWVSVRGERRMMVWMECCGDEDVGDVMFGARPVEISGGSEVKRRGNREGCVYAAMYLGDCCQIIVVVVVVGGC
jgi:hypothetical protein